MATSSVDAHLEVTPEREITFTLKENEATTTVELTLKHPDSDSAPVAFKVKTTQPRRYLVRPNQGLITPGGIEKVQILLVEKDKKQLLQQYINLGDAALEHCKDKFLVQSIAVSNTNQANELKNDYDKLTNFWSTIQNSTAGIANKKLQVRHRVAGSTSAAIASTARGGGTSPAATTSKVNPEIMNKEQLITEYNGLRKKYDELVAFSVNLTAERDILNNSLEQTKRDLQREMNSNKNSMNANAKSKNDKSNKKSGGFSFITVLFIMLMCLFGGAKLHHLGLVQDIPMIGEQFFQQNESSGTKTMKKSSSVSEEL